MNKETPRATTTISKRNTYVNKTDVKALSAIERIHVPSEEEIMRVKARGNSTCLPGFSEMRFNDDLAKSISACNKRSMARIL